MRTFDYDEIRKKIPEYSRIPVRIYRDGELLSVRQEMQLSEDFSVNNEDIGENIPTHNTYEFEKEMIAFIRKGDPVGLVDFFSHSSLGQEGIIGNTYLRQLKNIFIVSATLASRAAIEGGMSVEEALTLSDEYIRHNERYSTADSILHLQYHMILDYATRVEELSLIGKYSRPIRDTILYVRNHLTECIKIEQLTPIAFLSRSQLSIRFREETGLTIMEYIRKEKINNALELLLTTEMTTIAISNYLGFSSQSHFQKVFKQVTGMTPRNYRQQ